MKIKNLLIFIAGMLFLPVTVTVITIVVKIAGSNRSNINSIPISDYYLEAEDLNWYTSLGMIQTETCDESHSIVRADIALGYKKKDKSAFKEITKRTLELKDCFRRYLQSKTAQELRDSSNEDTLRQEIRIFINDEIFTDSKIIDVRFMQLDVIENTNPMDKENSIIENITNTYDTVKTENKKSHISSFTGDIDNFFEIAKVSNKSQIIAYLEKHGFEPYNTDSNNGNLYYQPNSESNITFYGMEMNAIVMGYYYDDKNFNLLTISIKKGNNWLKTKSLIEDAENIIINRYGFVYSEKANAYKNRKYSFSISENLYDICFTFSNW